MAAGYSMPDLHRVRQPLHHIHGIDLGLANPSLCHDGERPSHRSPGTIAYALRCCLQYWPKTQDQV